MFLKTKNQKLKTNFGFTLIEVLVVITIIGILTVWVFVPYNFYSNIAKVRVSKEIINQTINEARSNAFWLQTRSNKKNVNIWLVFEKWKKEIKMLTYPFNYSWSIVWEATWDIELLRLIKLEDQVELSKIDPDQIIIAYFEAPNWDLFFYKSWSKSPLDLTWVVMTVWYRWTTSWILSKEVEIKK